MGREPHAWFPCEDCAVQVLGNYGEIYERAVEAGSPLKMPRGRNALRMNGSLLHPLLVQ